MARCERLALHDREVDLDRVQPRRVAGQVHEHEVRPGTLEAVDRLLAAVDGAVVDNPEHPLRGGIGLCGHHVGDEGVEGVVADLRHAVAEQAALGIVDVERGQVGQRPAPPVLVFDQTGPSRTRRDERVATQQRLQLRLLVSRDHIVARVQPPTLPAALVEIERTAGLLAEVRVAREHPRAPRPRADRILGQPPPDRRPRDLADDPALDRFARELSRRPARQRPPGLGRQLARQRLDLGDLGGGKTTGDAPAWAAHPTQPAPPP